MSRSGYSEDYDDQWALIRWRGAVASAIRGRRGQAFLHELLDALDSMENKRLRRNALEESGEVCALGSLGKKRGMDMSDLDPDDYGTVAHEFGIPRALAQEIMFENDEVQWNKTPEERWQRMRAYIASLIKHPIPAAE